VFEVDIKLPAVVESYHCTLATSVPASAVAAIFTYTPSAYDNASVTKILDDVTAPEFADAALATCRDDEP
jgi:hypothetical protein